MYFKLGEAWENQFKFLKIFCVSVNRNNHYIFDIRFLLKMIKQFLTCFLKFEWSEYEVLVSIWCVSYDNLVFTKLVKKCYRIHDGER